MDNRIQYPTGFSLKDIVSAGNTGLVCLDAASNTVVKSPHDNSKEDSIEVERRIYERFQRDGGHRGLLQYHGPYESGIRLEYAPKWNLSNFLRKHAETSSQQRLQWAQQVTDALCFVHRANVIHGDLTWNNILLTDELDAKLADFAGSSLDGSALMIAVDSSHEYPGPLLSIKADLFALGSVLYSIMTGALPYQDLLQEGKEDEIKFLYEGGMFPETETVGPIGAIIMKCWQAKYDSAVDVHTEIEEAIVKHKSTISVQQCPSNSPSCS
ncbi:kinase-like protein [Amniculicola lignicola CBS 123094]|uniref:EKC/KEOPS complex subunit BUD32 n=1 Tax=Amniculicola lignicola CBS 123094 TaxID=1392246 RepID=A0A6A5VZ96_9PLEO|nr:kinase-like protein [Amniculicola lignicola CBS 123094]